MITDKSIFLTLGFILCFTWILSLFLIYSYYHLTSRGLAYKGMMPISMRIVLSVIAGIMSLSLILKGVSL